MTTTASVLLQPRTVPRAVPRIALRPVDRPTAVSGIAASPPALLNAAAAALSGVREPIAGWLVYLRSRTVAAWDPYRRAVRTLSLTSAAVGVLFLLSSAPSLFPGTPLADLFDDYLIHGLVERVLILCLFGLLLAIGVGAGRAGRTGRAVGSVSPARCSSARGRLSSVPARGISA